jgi:ecotin
MRIVVPLLWLSVFALCLGVRGAAPATGEADRNMKAFPPAEAGMVRYVLRLPAEQDETALKVELIVGKMAVTDSVNTYFFAGKIEDKNIEGWGFTRYVVNQLGPMAGTLMAPPPNAPKVNRFVPLAGEPYLIRYNSRLPVVVYVPEGVEVRYRLWTAPPKATAMDKG